MKYRIHVKDDYISWSEDLIRHRLYGSAVEWGEGCRTWYKNDKIHREDGPAIEWADNLKEWYIDDIPYSKEEFIKIIK